MLVNVIFPPLAKNLNQKMKNTYLKRYLLWGHIETLIYLYNRIWKIDIIHIPFLLINQILCRINPAYYSIFLSSKFSKFRTIATTARK